MTLEEFLERDRRFRAARPMRFARPSKDRSASDDQIRRVEQMLGCKLPQKYADFLRTIGGGDYASHSLFSADPDGDWYFPTLAARAASLVPPDLLPFCDDHSGGYFVFRIVNDEAQDSVWYWDYEDRTLSPTECADVFEFLVSRSHR